MAACPTPRVALALLLCAASAAGFAVSPTSTRATAAASAVGRRLSVCPAMLDKEEEERRERLRQLFGNDAANIVRARAGGAAQRPSPVSRVALSPASASLSHAHASRPLALAG